MELFGTKGQKFLHCPGTKGQRDKLKILPRDGTGRDFDRLSRPVPGRPAGQNHIQFCPLIPFSESKSRKFLQNFFFFKYFFFFFEKMAQKEPFCPAGRPGTEDLVPGFRVLLLSRDKGTAGRGNFFCPGTKGQRDTETFLSRDKGTTGRPVPVCPGTSRGTSRPLETLVYID